MVVGLKERESAAGFRISVDVCEPGTGLSVDFSAMERRRVNNQLAVAVCEDIRSQ